MIQPKIFLDKLSEGIKFFSGVPDSLLKGLILQIESDHKEKHFITANEGAAIAMASGYHIATAKIPLVYLQNSGLGNIINPLTSLADKEVYAIPMLLVIGWRGKPGIKDEPQHIKMGKVTLNVLQALEVPFFILKKDDELEWKESLAKAFNILNNDPQPVALVVEEGFFPAGDSQLQQQYELSSSDAIELLMQNFNPDDVVVCTTGKIGRTFYKINQRKGELIKKYFLNVGAMGHAGSMAAAMALSSKEHVVVFDGDGSLLMHLGSLTFLGTLKNKNFTYIVLNNGVHESVGGQPTVGFDVDLPAIATACGFTITTSVTSKKDIEHWCKSDWRNNKQFVEIKINSLGTENLPRPSETPKEAKERLMQLLHLNKKS